ncbi:hypothetical protein SSMG_01109 [Streptomyces sp. AA4]|uniref:phosphotransferase n=1 Tax=Amycolatopsis sp. AA4 TaxID=1896961 RepID=UPI0001B544C4|nr:phosphotransferase [Amycolatopsis sp. AA4]EFL05438.1 hypothetical protein SSMG_01109 [Streptomyces sp. AA4]
MTTLRVGDVFLKVDTDQARADAEVAAMALAPVPTPEIRWRKPPVLALAALPGRELGRPGAPSTASPAAWAAAGAAARTLHEAPLRPWPRVFTHGDLQVAHIFVEGDEVTGILDWSEAHQEHLPDVLAGYGADVDLDVLRAWWSLRSLRMAGRTRVRPGSRSRGLEGPAILVLE